MFNGLVNNISVTSSWLSATIHYSRLQDTLRSRSANYLRFVQYVSAELMFNGLVNNISVTSSWLSATLRKKRTVLRFYGPVDSVGSCRAR